MSSKDKLDVKCPMCGGTKFRLENPNLHLRDLNAVYRAEDGSITAEWASERVEQDERLILWCSGCPRGFSVSGWSEEETISALLDEMESAGLKP
jgi:hypothetical protein